MSTAHTLFEYVPQTYGVIVISEFNAAIAVGLFFSLGQAISAAVFSNPSFGISKRVAAFLTYGVLAYMDGWTDVIYRSVYGSGDTLISLAVTLGLYTFGTELMTAFTWSIIGYYAKPALSEILYFFAKLQNAGARISKEWKHYVDAAKRNDDKYVSQRVRDLVGGSEVRDKQQVPGSSFSPRNSGELARPSIQNSFTKPLSGNKPYVPSIPSTGQGNSFVNNNRPPQGK